MTERTLTWMFSKKTIHIRNISFVLGEVCFWYVVVDLVRMAF